MTVKEDINNSNSDDETIDITNIRTKAFKIDFTSKKQLRKEINKWKCYFGISLIFNVILVVFNMI